MKKTGKGNFGRYFVGFAARTRGHFLAPRATAARLRARWRASARILLAPSRRPVDLHRLLGFGTTTPKVAESKLFFDRRNPVHQWRGGGDADSDGGGSGDGGGGVPPRIRALPGPTGQNSRRAGWPGKPPLSEGRHLPRARLTIGDGHLMGEPPRGLRVADVKRRPPSMSASLVGLTLPQPREADDAAGDGGGVVACAVAAALAGGEGGSVKEFTTRDENEENETRAEPKIKRNESAREWTKREPQRNYNIRLAAGADGGHRQRPFALCGKLKRRRTTAASNKRAVNRGRSNSVVRTDKSKSKREEIGRIKNRTAAARVQREKVRNNNGSFQVVSAVRRY